RTGPRAPPAAALGAQQPLVREPPPGVVALGVGNRRMGGRCRAPGPVRARRTGPALMGAGRCRGVTERGRPCRNLAAGGGAWCGRCRGAPALPAKNPAASPVAAALTPPAAAAADPLDAGVPTWTVGSRSTAAIAGDIDTDPRLLARFAA